MRTGGSGDVGTIDPSLNAFLEFRYAAGRHSFAGVGAEFLNVFYSGKSVGVLIRKFSRAGNSEAPFRIYFTVILNTPSQSSGGGFCMKCSTRSIYTCAGAS